MTEKLLIQGGRLVDPSTKKDRVLDLLCVDGKISKIAKNIPVENGMKVISAKGLIVSPGFIDLHTHLREPGHEYKETIRTGTRAAAAGGFTTIFCMPNTKPVNDNAMITELIARKASDEGIVNVFPVGAISQGLKGDALADIGQMAGVGVLAISDDGHCVMNSALMRKAMQYARGFGLMVISHAEDTHLGGPDSINEGIVATELGLPGSPNAAEDIMISRDIALAELTGTRLHIAHVTTRHGLELVEAAKARGVEVTCEVCPHHFTLDHTAVRGYNTMAKMRPPLRSPEDVLALKKGIRNGVIDCVATDHAPHATFEKEVPFVEAANGLVGLETALSLTLALHESGLISLSRLVELLSCGPARVVRLKEKGSLKQGYDADITIFDPREKRVINTEEFYSLSTNTPFHGWKVKGVVKFTIVGGTCVYENGSLVGL